MAFKKGISHSQEHRNKISKALTGKKAIMKQILRSIVVIIKE